MSESTYSVTIKNPERRLRPQSREALLPAHHPTQHHTRAISLTSDHRTATVNIEGLCKVGFEQDPQLRGQHSHPGLAHLGGLGRLRYLPEDVIAVAVRGYRVQGGHDSHFDPSHEGDGQVGRDDDMGMLSTALDVGVGHPGHVGVEVAVHRFGGALRPPGLERSLALGQMRGVLEVSGRFGLGKQMVIGDGDDPACCGFE